MNLKSNIWDHVREEDESDDSDNRRHQTAVRPGSSPETSGHRELQHADSKNSHANRHGISMKSLMKNRTT